MADVNYIHVNLSTGSYLLVEETEATKKKVWEKFLRIVYCDTRKMVTDDNSCRGYAACKVCGQICRLGPKGGTKELEDHFSLCSRAAADNTALRLAEKQLKKENKNQTEKERKDEIKALNKESAYLVIGQESETIPLEEITKARLTRACLSEIPPSIVQFFTDGKSPKDRPMNFYEELQVQLDVLWQRFSEAKNEAYTAYTEAQNGALFTKQQAIYTVQNATPVQPNLHIGLSYSSANGIDITWVPTDVKSTLDFDRISMIGRNLSELVHPEDYAEIVRVFLTDSSTDGTVKDSKDFTFPDCRITESIIHRSKTGPEYHTVFLTGYIRQCIRTSREKASHQDKQIMPARTDSSCWPRLASFIHIRTYYQYMTLHSIDGRIIQADKRIKMVAGYTCEEVVNKKAHDFIVEDAVSFVSEAQNNWVYYNGRANCISYPLKGKHRIVHVKSRGEFIYYRDSETNQMIDGFILSNTLIHEDDYQRERSNLQVQWNTSCDTSTSSVEESYNISSSTPEACNTGTPVPMEQDSINDLNETTDFQMSLALSPDIYS